MTPSAITSNNDFAAQALAFMNIHRYEATQTFAANLRTEIASLDIGHLQLPSTVGNDSDTGNAWVCSPCTAYGDYAAEEAYRIGHPLFTWPLLAICRSLAHLLRRGELDRAVTINNWLLSTNLYPSATSIDVASIRDAAVARWPSHAIWFRSLNWQYNADWLSALLTAGFELIPSRQVYLVDDVAQAARKHNDLKRDWQLLKRTPYVRVGNQDFAAKDYERAAHLYTQLYTLKYSTLNPQYSAEFMLNWHRAGLLNLQGFRDTAGELQAVVGIFGVGATLTAPVVGYNTKLPQQDGLYRLLMACVAEVGLHQNARLNLSAGAAQFKRLRGAAPTLEYSAVYSAHLSPSRRRPIATLKFIAEHIGAPIMRKLKL